MKFSTHTRVFAMLIFCVLMMNGCTALADSVIVTNKAAVYAAADETSAVLGVMSVGTELNLVAYKGGWAKVSKGKNVGFMQIDALAKVEKYNKPGYTVQDVPMYKSFSTSSKQLGVIPADSKVTVKAIAGDWAAVTYGKYSGFVSAAALTPNAPTKAETEEMSITAYANVNGAKVYNAKGKVIGTVAVNTVVTITAINNGICRVERDGATAYMKKSQLSTEPVEVKEEPDDGITHITPTTFYVKNDGAKVYNAKGKVLGTLSQNTALTVDAYNDELARVSSGKNTGLMYKTDLSDKPIAVQDEVEEESNVTEIAPTTFYVKNDGAKVYSASKEVLCTLSLNDTVTVNAYSDDLARVVNGSSVGFMYKTDLSDKKIAVSYELKYGDKGEAVKKVQTRLKELGYFTGSIGGNYLELTQSAVSAFQSAAKLTANGICDEKTLTAMFADDAPKKKAPADNNAASSSNATGPSTATPATGSAIEMDWWTSDIQSIFARGVTAVVTDVSTGMAWREKRTGGTNHADVQPVTAADTAAMRKAVGSWSWNRRAIFVTINGVNYAASMNCMPHGGGSIKDNNFNGHHCIHFTNSRTHGSNKMCSLHQNAIKKALNATL